MIVIPRPGGWTAGIVGCGSAGTRIARLLAEAGWPRDSIFGYDRDGHESRWAWPGVAGVQSELRTDHHVWFVCTPASERVNYYEFAVWRGQNTRGIFAEKPVCDYDDGRSRRRIEVAMGGHRMRGIVTHVGYCWRWHPAAVAARAWLRGQAVFVQGMSATFWCFVDRTKWGGLQGTYRDLLLEMSHEIDLAIHLLGPAEVIVAAEHDERWDLMLWHTAGAVSTVHLAWDYGDSYSRGFSIMGGGDRFEWKTNAFADPGVPGCERWSPDVMYAEQLSAFIAASAGLTVAHPVTPCTWTDGLAVVDICARARLLASKD